MPHAFRPAASRSGQSSHTRSAACLVQQELHPHMLVASPQLPSRRTTGPHHASYPIRAPLVCSESLTRITTTNHGIKRRHQSNGTEGIGLGNSPRFWTSLGWFSCANALPVDVPGSGPWPMAGTSARPAAIASAMPCLRGTASGSVSSEAAADRALRPGRSDLPAAFQACVRSQHCREDVPAAAGLLRLR